MAGGLQQSDSDRDHADGHEVADHNIEKTGDEGDPAGDDLELTVEKSADQFKKEDERDDRVDHGPSTFPGSPFRLISALMTAALLVLFYC